MARNSNMLIGAAVVVGGLWYLFGRNTASAATPVIKPTSPVGGGVGPLTISPPAPVPGSLAPTPTTLQITAAVWQNLTPTTGPGNGYVDFPTGSQAPAGLLQWATDTAGNYYTQWAGQIYIVNVAQMDANGNYTATLLGSGS